MLPCPWDSPGKNTEVGCRTLFQQIFLTQGLNPCLLHLLHWHIGSLPLVSTWEAQEIIMAASKISPQAEEVFRSQTRENH